ncbi:hypothetical protein C2W63_02923 [Bacillus velezensis]|nr:hypothetical protein C2W63_02923 [Bacillus velezensis]
MVIQLLSSFIISADFFVVFAMKIPYSKHIVFLLYLQHKIRK